jgi:hypothetical protein
MKQSDLFRENANSCLQLAKKAPDHGFVRICKHVVLLRTARPTPWKRTHKGDSQTAVWPKHLI